MQLLTIIQGKARKMARVTVEDCILKVPNRFELVLLAAKRAREISAGAPLTVARDNDKNPVVSLREISESSIDIPALRENLIRGFQRHVFVEEHDSDFDEDVQDALGAHGIWEDEMRGMLSDGDDDRADDDDGEEDDDDETAEKLGGDDSDSFSDVTYSDEVDGDL